MQNNLGVTETTSIFEIKEFKGHVNRFIVVETTEKGKLKIHNANGYGFKSKENANRFINYKKYENSINLKKETIKNWLNEHKKFADDLENEIFIVQVKDNETFTKDDFMRVMHWNNLTELDLPHSWKTILKYW